MMASYDSILNNITTVSNFKSIELLNFIVNQATGKTSLGHTTTQDFVSVANTALSISTDTLLSAISQTLSRTIFSVRPYEAKFKGLMKDEVRFGNHVRKLNIGDKDWEKDVRYDLVDGQSIDDQIVSSPTILQTNFYGQNVYSRHYTIYRDQLNIELSREEE